MRIGIVCYPTVGGSGVVATEMAIALAALSGNENAHEATKGAEVGDRGGRSRQDEIR